MSIAVSVCTFMSVFRACESASVHECGIVCVRSHGQASIHLTCVALSGLKCDESVNSSVSVLALCVVCMHARYECVYVYEFLLAVGPCACMHCGSVYVSVCFCICI